MPIALTAGDPAGIGIELTASAYESLRDELVFFLIADRRQLAKQLPIIPICEISDPVQAPLAMRDGLPLYHVDFPIITEPGMPATENAEAVISSINIAVEMAQKGLVSSICTNPVNKRLLKKSGHFNFPGQTEYIADLCNIDHPLMMLVSPILRVVLLTTHIPICEVSKWITEDRIISTVNITSNALCHDFNIKNPRIAVVGLNPHAGEEGIIGREEIEIITPTLNKLNNLGIRITGPHSGDTLFHDDARNTFDAAICMYHDQGLIPIKTLDFFGAVNVTLGLPIVRTSPDHGTGFDIAGKGVARSDSLIQALKLSQEIVHNRSVSE